MALRTDINIAQLPATPPNVGGLLGKNKIVIDPDFGTQIMRLTDGGDATFHSLQTSDSSGALIWNSNDTLIFATSTGGTKFLYQFDPATMQGTKLPFSTTATPSFSATMPGWFYALSGSVVTKYVFTLVGGVWTFASSSTVCDFANILPAGFKVKWTGEFLVSNDDTTFSAGFSAGGQGTGIYACVYQTGHGGAGLGFRMANVNTGQITGDWGPTGAINLITNGSTTIFPFTLHEVVQTANPLYATIGPTGIGTNGKPLDTTIVWTLATLNFVDLNSGGHKAKGYVHAYAGAGGGQVKEIPYVNPVQPFRNVVPSAGKPAGFHGDNHFGFGRIDVADASIVWATTGDGTPQPFTSAWEGEVIGYEIVTGIVYRACHTFNSFKSKEFVVTQSICVPSKTGNFVAFTSDWGGAGTLGPLGSTSGGATGIIGVDARGDVFIVKVNSSIALPLTVRTSALAGGTVGTGYSQTLQAAGGASPYSWAVTVGSLPAGLSLNGSTGVISGTPSSNGTSNFTVTATDSTSPTPQTASAALSITIAAGILPLKITTSGPLTPGVVGSAYPGVTLLATGGVAAYSWAVTAGSLPAGLALGAASGIISGTPSAVGTANFTVTVTDAEGTPQTASSSFSIAIAAAAATLSIATSSLAGGLVNTGPYSQTMQAVGAVLPLSWAVTAGALPVGLALTGATGVISGTPTVAGVASFTVTATDSMSPTPQTAGAALSIAISDSRSLYDIIVIGNAGRADHHLEILTRVILP
jgi:hypothetical protein